MGNGRTEKKCKFGIISPGIVGQIDVAKTSIQENPDFNSARKHQIYHGLELEANRHSVAMERPGGGKVRRGRVRNGELENLRMAQAYFCQEYGDGWAGLTEDLLRGTAYLIEPHFGNPAPYRAPGTISFSSGGESVYPRPEKIAEEMRVFLEENKQLACGIERAFHAHLHLPRIHPFIDGNGRLARVVQNGILNNCSLPPVIIATLERGDYIDLLVAAQRSYKEHRVMKPEQTAFYDYLSMKLLESLSRTGKALERKKR